MVFLLFPFETKERLPSTQTSLPSPRQVAMAPPALHGPGAETPPSTPSGQPRPRRPSGRSGRLVSHADIGVPFACGRERMNVRHQNGCDKPPTGGFRVPFAGGDDSHKPSNFYLLEGISVASWSPAKSEQLLVVNTENPFGKKLKSQHPSKMHQRND